MSLPIISPKNSVILLLDKKLFEEILEIDTYDLLNAISGKSSYNEKYESIITQLSKLSTLKNGKK